MPGGRTPEHAAPADWTAVPGLPGQRAECEADVSGGGRTG